ncbi:hypothetical protein [Scytonema sp. PCC 10023]|uniref:hypothetical protein n=1 Tax=Scytonema sp. PCC 10023 TaxID=1680591 RepID=UPI0039C5CB87
MKLTRKYSKAQELVFSSQVDLMSLVVCGIQKSVHAAYKARATNLIVSSTLSIFQQRDKPEA